MIKRTIIAIAFGLTIFAAGLEAEGPRDAHALHTTDGYWTGFRGGECVDDDFIPGPA